MSRSRVRVRGKWRRFALRLRTNTRVCTSRRPPRHAAPRRLCRHRRQRRRLAGNCARSRWKRGGPSSFFQPRPRARHRMLFPEHPTYPPRRARYHASFPWKRADPRIRSLARLLFTADSRTLLPPASARSMESVPSIKILRYACSRRVAYAAASSGSKETRYLAAARFAVITLSIALQVAISF